MDSAGIPEPRSRSDSTAAQLYVKTTRRRLVRIWFFRLATVFFSTTILLVATEIVLRIMGLGYGLTRTIGHPVFHHWHRTDYSFVEWSLYNDYEGFVNHYNHEGFPMQDELPSPEQPTVLFLGDSFVEGNQVPEEKRFVSLVGKALGVPALNFGCGSFSPLLSRLQLEYFGERIRPMAVVLALYSNDIEDDSKYASLDAVRFDQRGKIIAVPGVNTSLPIRLARWSYFARLVGRAWLVAEYTYGRSRRLNRDWGVSSWEPFFPKPIEECFISEELDRFHASILEIRQECRNRGVPLYLCVVPDRGSLREKSRDYFAEHINSFASSHGIEYIDLPTAFRGRPVGELFFSTDIHFTEQGHHVAAEAMLDTLKKLAR